MPEPAMRWWQFRPGVRDEQSKIRLGCGRCGYGALADLLAAVGIDTPRGGKHGPALPVVAK